MKVAGENEQETVHVPLFEEVQNSADMMVYMAVQVFAAYNGLGHPLVQAAAVLQQCSIPDNKLPNITFYAEMHYLIR